MSNRGSEGLPEEKPSSLKEGGQSRALVTQEESDPTVPQQLQILVELEKQRIDSHNRRTDVARYAIEMNDASDKRQFEYRMARLATEESKSVRRHGLARNVAIGGGLGAVRNAVGIWWRDLR